MLSEVQKRYLIDNGYKVSDLKTDNIYWIYSHELGYNIAVKNDVWELYEQGWGVLKHMATISRGLDLEQFIILCAAFGIVCPELAVTKN